MGWKRSPEPLAWSPVPVGLSPALDQCGHGFAGLRLQVLQEQRSPSPGNCSQGCITHLGKEFLLMSDWKPWSFNLRLLPLITTSSHKKSFSEMVLNPGARLTPATSLEDVFTMYKHSECSFAEILIFNIFRWTLQVKWKNWILTASLSCQSQAAKALQSSRCS